MGAVRQRLEEVLDELQALFLAWVGSRIRIEATCTVPSKITARFRPGRGRPGSLQGCLAGTVLSLQPEPRKTTVQHHGHSIDSAAHDGSGPPPARRFGRPYLPQPCNNKRGTLRLLPDALSGLFPFPFNTSLIHKKYVNLDLIVGASDPIFELIPLESIKDSFPAPQIPPQDQ